MKALPTLLIPHLLVLLSMNASASAPPPAVADNPLNDIAEEYVHLALLLQNHDTLQYLYTGPEDWRERAREQADSLAQVQAALQELGLRLSARPASKDPQELRRRRDLSKRISATVVRADILQEKYPTSFDDETQLMFGVVVPQYGEAHFRSLAADLEALVPGPGPLPERIERFRDQFVIPAGRLEAVIGEAIRACRQRTLEHLALPENETVTLNITTGKHWVGFTEYLGDSRSVIHINRDVPIHIERAIELGCHEAYPGHHVQATLFEQEMVQRRGWVEYSFLPLYGPLAVIAEGGANYGIDLAFTREERIAFERSTLLPLAGLGGKDLDRYYHYIDLIHLLNYARNEVARQYLYQGLSREDAIRWLMEFGLETRGTATQRLEFIAALRSYVINYNYGQDLVAAYINGKAGDDRNARWKIYEEVVTTPLAPEDMMAMTPR